MSGCVADGRLIILDVAADRYRMLPPAAETAILRHFHGDGLQCGDERALARLLANGILQVQPDGVGGQLCGHALPELSFFDDPWRTPGAVAVARAALSVVRAMADLRLRGLARTLEAFPRSNSSPAAALSCSQRHAAAFAELRLIMRTLDRCLPLSIALARTARRSDGDIRLVIGVKLDPFGAHAWVQRGNVVLNDRLDAVVPFTPILVR
ncbi:lasso peptide biosynthesis B2 protein [Novosphingobium sp. Gsoil 351]|uniref:lasso peptide biosynthesis B2 protein n=1 Tax=Novosphingobium sp. Gsoil 351 TaxID=2675225 RepID=UPI0018A86DD8|nr:lasso peptide biosynthesis B2 protein [Novosphingobium sp. Gsoil 351]